MQGRDTETSDPDNTTATFLIHQTSYAQSPLEHALVSAVASSNGITWSHAAVGEVSAICHKRHSSTHTHSVVQKLQSHVG